MRTNFKSNHASKMELPTVETRSCSLEEREAIAICGKMKKKNEAYSVLPGEQACAGDRASAADHLLLRATLPVPTVGALFWGLKLKAADPEARRA